MAYNPVAQPTRFAGESWRTAMKMHSRAVGAVVMRDIQTRFGASYAGFLLGLIMPLGHLGATLVAMAILAANPPIGPDIATFLMTGILPFILWLYCHKQVMISLVQNRPLLYFPGVDPFDLIFARMIVEIPTSTLVVLIVMAALAVTGYGSVPANFPSFLGALGQAWLLGVGTGLVVGGIAAFWPPFLISGSLLAPLFWATAGVIYLPDRLPDAVRNVIWYFPLSHIVDDLRQSYFSEYYSSFSDSPFQYLCILVTITIGMAIMPIIRKVT